MEIFVTNDDIFVLFHQERYKLDMEILVCVTGSHLAVLFTCLHYFFVKTVFLHLLVDLQLMKWLFFYHFCNYFVFRNWVLSMIVKRSGEDFENNFFVKFFFFIVHFYLVKINIYENKLCKLRQTWPFICPEPIKSYLKCLFFIAAFSSYI